MSLVSETPTLSPFQVAALPEIQFGQGQIRQLPQIIQQRGQHALIVTGQNAFISTSSWSVLKTGLEALGITWDWIQVDGEPSPQLVDASVAQHRQSGIDVVAGIGGGSVLDAAKAIAGLLRTGTSVMDHLEGVGNNLPYTGPSVPLIAVPTTAGTGSEATRNAVLSVQGENGFKKSFRDNQLVARIALVDPDLLASCPRSQIAANGMDALTQLLESYVSTRANPVTDALAWSGMEAFKAGFWAAWEGDHTNASSGYTQLAYASLMSGVTLAQAGLGSVHGFASPLGAFFPMPHGVVCGTLLAEATATNIHALRARSPDSTALPKYARVGRLMTGQSTLSDTEAGDALIECLRVWVRELDLPQLGAYGMAGEDIPRVCAGARGSSMKTNPLELTDAELAGVLECRL